MKKKEIKEIIKESYQYKGKERIQELRDELRDLWISKFNEELIEKYGDEGEEAIKISKKYPDRYLNYRSYSVVFIADGVSYTTTLTVKIPFWNYEFFKTIKIFDQFPAPRNIMEELQRLTEEEKEFRRAMNILQRKATSDNELINNFPELC